MRNVLIALGVIGVALAAIGELAWRKYKKKHEEEQPKTANVLPEMGD